MPRITGPDIATHVATQEAAVLAAATALFAQRGYARVSMGDIADAVGLARTSLYRYFPDKDHILLAWLRRDIGHLLERSEEVAGDRADRPDAEDRLRAWLTLQFEFLRDPEHSSVMGLAGEMDAMGEEVRAEVVEQHARLYASVERIVADAIGSKPGTRRTTSTAAFVAGLLRTANDLLSRGTGPEQVHRDLEAAAVAVVRAAVPPVPGH